MHDRSILLATEVGDDAAVQGFNLSGVTALGSETRAPGAATRVTRYIAWSGPRPGAPLRVVARGGKELTFVKGVGWTFAASPLFVAPSSSRQ